MKFLFLLRSNTSSPFRGLVGVLVIFLLTISTLNAQQTLRGKVIDAASRQPIEAASIVLKYLLLDIKQSLFSLTKLLNLP
jgi:hypothetical protein